MRRIALAVLCMAIVGAANALTASVTATLEGEARPAIVGRTNLPDGTELMVELSRKESSYAAQDKVSVKGGAFRAGPFTQKGANLNPGTYLVTVTMPVAAVQPTSVSSAIGEGGSKLEGPLVKRSSFGGNVVRYQTSVKVGVGSGSVSADKAARAQDAKDTHAWWLFSCKSTCTTAQSIATQRTEPFSFESCYAKCVAAERKR